MIKSNMTRSVIAYPLLRKDPNIFSICKKGVGKRAQKWTVPSRVGIEVNKTINVNPFRFSLFIAEQ